MIELYWFWAIIGLAAFILEIVMGTQFFFFLLGFSAILTAVGTLLLPSLGGFTSGVIFAVISSALLLIFWKGWLQPLYHEHESADLNNSLVQLYQRQGSVIRSNGSKLTIHLEKNLWSAEDVDKRSLPAETTVKVVGHRGMVLIVEPVDSVPTESQ